MAIIIFNVNKQVLMNKRTKNSEYEHFNKLANEWWSETGKYKILHKIKPIRIKYIFDNLGLKSNKKLKILDLGCGGGLVCEPLAKIKSGRGQNRVFECCE